jgi:hypothetical protein
MEYLHDRQNLQVFLRGASFEVGMKLAILLFLLVVAFWPGPVCSQTVRATLLGTVTDQAGAVVPEAKVAVTNVGTGAVKQTATDASGDYEFPDLFPATYRITVERAGFETLEISGITLLVDQQAHVDAQLRVGAVTEKIQVTGAAPMVEAATASIGGVVGDQQMLEMPLNARHFGALAVLLPGTIAAGSLSGDGSPFGDTAFTTNGLRNTSNTLELDGMEDRFMRVGGFSLQPPPDALQEFKVQTEIYNAAYGITGGATINVITKSGTNDFHGGVYDFLRNRDLDSRNFFATDSVNPATGVIVPGTARPPYQRNQFGGNIGGPIQKNKTFIFGYYEGTQDIEGQSLTSLVPTAVERTGNLSSFLTGTTVNLCGSGGPANLNYDTGQLFQPATETLFTCPAGSAEAGSNIVVGTPVSGNIFTSIDPVAAKVLQSFPEPNLVGIPNYINQTPERDRWNQFGARLDHTISSKDQIYGRYLFGNVLQFEPGWRSPFPGFEVNSFFRGQNIVLSENHTFGPNLLNEARIGFHRDWAYHGGVNDPRPAGFAENFGIAGLTALPGGEAYPEFYTTNFGMVGDLYATWHEADMIEHYQDNVTWVHGRHTVVVGGGIDPWQMFKLGVPTATSGRFYFNGKYSSLGGAQSGTSSIADLADLIQGFPSSAVNTTRFSYGNAAGGNFTSLYAQDDFKVTSRFAMSFGLRWEFRRPYYFKQDNNSVLIPVAPEWSGPGNMLYFMGGSDALNNSYCTNPAYASFIINSEGECLVANNTLRHDMGFTGRTARTLMYPYYRGFNPRLGFVWRPTHSDKLVLRTGYGIFSDFADQQWAQAGTFNPVFVANEQYLTTSGTPPPQNSAGVPISIHNLFTTSSAFTAPTMTSLLAQSNTPAFNPNPIIQEYSFGIESQLARDWALDVEYVGNNATRLTTFYGFANQPYPGVGALQPRRPYPDFGQIGDIGDDSISRYNSLQAKLTKRFSAGFLFLISYTYANALDDNEGDDENVGQQNTNCVRCDYGPSDYDARHVFSASYVWQLPVGQGQRFLNQKGVVDRVLGGWHFTGIVSAQSGIPFSVYALDDYSNTSSSGERPDRTCNGSGPKTLAEWYNTNCFTNASLSAALSAGTPRFGNAGRNILSAPGLVDWDMGLFKDFAVTERAKLEFRFESFDFLNNVNFGSPGSTIGSSTAGVITNAGNAREIQFGLKLTF